MCMFFFFNYDKILDNSNEALGSNVMSLRSEKNLDELLRPVISSDHKQLRAKNIAFAFTQKTCYVWATLLANFSEKHALVIPAKVIDVMY